MNLSNSIVWDLRILDEHLLNGFNLLVHLFFQDHVGRLEGFRWDDEVVGTDVLKYTMSSITVFIWSLQEVTRKPTLGQCFPVNASFSNNFLLLITSSTVSKLPLPLMVVEKEEQLFLLLRLLAWYNQRSLWQSHKESISLLHGLWILVALGRVDWTDFYWLKIQEGS